MRRLHIFLVLCLLVVCINESKQQGVSLYGPDVAKVGERVFMQCLANGQSGRFFLTLEGQPVCSTDIGLNPECDETRYACFAEAIFDLQRYEKLLVVAVKKVTRQDGGTYSCRVEGQFGLEANKTLQVYEEETPEVQITDKAPEKHCSQTFICQTEQSFSKVNIIWSINPIEKGYQTPNETSIAETGAIVSDISNYMRINVSYLIITDGGSRTSNRSVLTVEMLNSMSVNCTVKCSAFNILTPNIKKEAVYNVTLVSRGSNVETPGCTLITILSAGVGVTITAWCAVGIAANRRRRKEVEERRRNREEEEEKSRLEERRRRESVPDQTLPPPLPRV